MQPRPTLVDILDGREPSNVGPVFFERPPFTAFKYSGGGITIMHLVLMDAFARPFMEIARDSVLEPLGMDASTFEQPLPSACDAEAARAHSWEGRSMDAKWHVYPEEAAAGLWSTSADLARFVIEVQQALCGPVGRVLSLMSAREMVTRLRLLCLRLQRGGGVRGWGRDGLGTGRGEGREGRGGR